VIRFINAFREFAADGVLTRAEWKQLEELAAGDNLDIKEALHYAYPDVSELVRKGVEIAIKDDVITEHEEKYFDFLLSILAVPESLVNEVRSTLSEYKTAQEIKAGNLPTVQPSFNLWPREICHFELEATYINTVSRYRNGKVKANWFSGDLRLPEGKLLQYVHMGYGSVYERELTLSVESGRVTKESVVDYTQITLPSELELQRRELEKMKPNPVR
jgi:hypothetical protein